MAVHTLPVTEDRPTKPATAQSAAPTAQHGEDGWAALDLTCGQTGRGS